jgi:hypothetical protein
MFHFTAYISVYRTHARYLSADNYMGWQKEITAPFVPSPGDRIELWEDGPYTPVRERDLNWTGEGFVELAGVVIDPDANEETWQRRSGSIRNWSWYSEHQGSLEEGLKQGGWTTAR